MELLHLIYPYTLYVLYAVIFITVIFIINLLIKTNKFKKQLKTTLEPVPNITSNINVTKEKINFINTKTRAQIESAKDIISYVSTGLFFINIFKKRRNKRRR